MIVPSQGRLVSSPNSICSLNSSLPCEVAFPQVPGIRMWTLLGVAGYHSVYHVVFVCPIVVSRWLPHLQLSYLHSREGKEEKVSRLHLQVLAIFSGKQKLAQWCPEGLFTFHGLVTGPLTIHV